MNEKDIVSKLKLNFNKIEASDGIHKSRSEQKQELASDAFKHLNKKSYLPWKSQDLYSKIVSEYRARGMYEEADLIENHAKGLTFGEYLDRRNPDALKKDEMSWADIRRKEYVDELITNAKYIAGGTAIAIPAFVLFDKAVYATAKYLVDNQDVISGLVNQIIHLK